MNTKTCTRCKQTKPATSFSTDRSQPDGLLIYCKSCISEKRKTPAARATVLAAVKRYEQTEKGKQAKLQYRKSPAYRQAYIRRTYGLEPEQYDGLLARQNHSCAICRKKFEKTPHVDHDHQTGEVRGLLCRGCNHVLGLMEDNVECFEAAIAYLKPLAQNHF